MILIGRIIFGITVAALSFSIWLASAAYATHDEGGDQFMLSMFGCHSLSSLDIAVSFNSQTPTGLQALKSMVANYETTTCWRAMPGMPLSMWFDSIIKETTTGSGAIVVIYKVHDGVGQKSYVAIRETLLEAVEYLENVGITARKEDA